jgi:hypothetical protein
VEEVRHIGVQEMSWGVGNSNLIPGIFYCCFSCVR